MPGYKIEPVGKVSNGKGAFNLYLYTFKSGSDGGARLSIRLFVLSEHNEYLGFYELSDIPDHIEGNELYFKADESEHSKIVFDGAVPPKMILIDGEPFEFVSRKSEADTERPIKN